MTNMRTANVAKRTRPVPLVATIESESVGRCRVTMKMPTVVLSLMMAALLCAACSSGTSSPAAIAAAKGNVEHWQAVVNQDQAQLSQDEGCPLNSATANCTPRVSSPKALEAQAKLKADETLLFTSENELTKAEGQ